MAWDNDTVLQILDDLGREATLWILVMSQGRTVGTGMASHYSQFPGKIQSYAKSEGIDPPEEDEIRDGFKRLRRVEFPDWERSTDSVILGDKPDYVKLTRHGITLVKLVSSRDDLRRSVKQNIGIEVEQDEEWWPREYEPENATVKLNAVSDPPEDDSEEYEIDAVAEFKCGRCDTEIEHSYSFVEPNEAWSKKVETTCPECGIGWKHLAGDPYDNPDAFDLDDTDS